MSKEFVWAVDENGKPCKCFAKPENRGKRNCNHKFHAKPGQSSSEFFKEHGILKSISLKKKEDFVDDNQSSSKEISQQEIDELANKIDQICGCRVTEENYNEVINSLTPEQLDALNKVGFEAAPSFSLPVTDEEYDEVNIGNKIYFANLPDYKIGGKAKAMKEMFGSIGPVPAYGGEEYEISGNYRDGLSARDYFEKQFSTRGSQISKVVAVSKPGHCARLSFYALADTEVIEDCGADHSHGVMGCKAPGICKKCAAQSNWKVETGTLVGGIVSTHITEGLTQASLNSIHTGTGGKADWEVIESTVMGYKTSPIIEKAMQCGTTMEARETIFSGLKEYYSKAGIDIDDYNLQVVARKLTQYKRDNKTGQLRYVKDGELCDFPSLQTIGGHNNLFLQSELRNSYAKLARPQIFDNTRNSVTSIAQ